MSATRPIEEALAVVRELTSGHHLGLLCSVDGNQSPHATYMGSVLMDGVRRVYTISVPEGRKISNIRANPRVEWLFTDETHTRVIYLRGQAKIVEVDTEIMKAWRLLPDKSRAYFLRFQERGIGFAVIETVVSEIEYCVPSENIFMRVPLEAFRD